MAKLIRDDRLNIEPARRARPPQPRAVQRDDPPLLSLREFLGVELPRFGGHPESGRVQRPMGDTDAEEPFAIPARVPG